MRLLYFFYVLIYKRILQLYLKTDSNIRFDGFKLKVLRGVFHPKLFFSTKYFYSFLKEQDFTGTHFLEIGSGSGILSMLALRKDAATVTAVDIDPKAVENTRVNFSENFNFTANVKVLQGDVLNNLPKRAFDRVVINPPYYFKKISTDDQYAWYCGENGEYFENLFSKLADYIHSQTLVYMILEENCEINRIKEMAAQYNLHFVLVDKKKIKWETSYIFCIKNG
jgi:release factor glutamine methyltransferase